MNATNRLLNRCKQTLQITSDYALAKALDVAQQRISNYRTGKAQADAEMAVRIAHVLKTNVENVLAEIEHEKATTEKTRSFWKGLIRNAATVTLACYTSIQVYGCLYIM